LHEVLQVFGWNAQYDARLLEFEHNGLHRINYLKFRWLLNENEVPKNGEIEISRQRMGAEGIHVEPADSRYSAEVLDQHEIASSVINTCYQESLPIR